MKDVRIGTARLGAGQPCYVIAEAGSNHDGKLAQALQLIDVAAEAGADAVKFQLFRADRLYPKTAGVSRYLGVPTPIYDIIAGMQMPGEWIPELAAACLKRDVDFLVSAFDEDSADTIDSYVSAFKVASYEMTHLPLVTHVARKGKPLMISTGTATLDEVGETVDAVRAAGNDQLVLMQCTASYPAPIDTLNLRAMKTMGDRFGVPVGLSDHSRHPLVGPMAAVACGAVAVEKHFTLSNGLPGPDHRFALEPAELRQMVEGIRQVEAALGSSEKRTDPVEEELRSFARRTVFTRRPIQNGEEITSDNVIILRCGEHPAGFSPAQYTEVLGRHAARHIAADVVLQPEDLA